VAETLAEVALVARGDMSKLRGDTVGPARRMGEDAGREFGDGFTRGADGRIRSSDGRFVASGKSSAKAFASGFGSSNALTHVASLTAARFALVGASAAAAAPGILHFAAALAPATGALVALPAAMMATVAAGATLKVATAGVGDAITKEFTGTAKQAKKAMDALPPAAQAFARSIIRLKPALDALRASVSERFFRPLQDEIAPLAAKYLPMLKASMSDVAGPLGGLAEQFAQSAGKAAMFSAVRNLFDQTATALVRVRAAIDPLMIAFADLLNATLPLMPGMAGGFADAAKRAGEFVSEASKSGQVKQIFLDAMTALRDMAAIVGNVAGIFGSFYSAANSGSSTLLGNLREMTGRAREFFATSQTGEVLRSLFASLSVIGAALRDTLGAALIAVGKSIVILVPGLTGLATVASRVVVALAPLVPMVAFLAARILESVVPALHSMIDATATVVGWLDRHRGVAVTLAAVVGGLAVVMQAHAAALAVAAAGGLVAWFRGTTLIAGATKVWAAAQWALNAALAPVGLIIGAVVVAVGLLVAGVIYAYKHHEGFRDLVQRVWAGIQSAAGAVAAWFTGTALPMMRAAWSGISAGAQAMWAVISPVLSVFANHFRTVVGPAVMWLWRNVVSPAFTAIGAAVSFAWTSVIQPTLGFLVAYFRNFVGPTITWLWRNIVSPAFTAIGFIVKAMWAVIQVPLAAISTILRNVVGPSIAWLWRNVVVPHMAGIRGAIQAAWNFIKPIFLALGGFIKTTVAPAFLVGVNAIGKAWDGLKEKAKGPVRFVVNSVINPLIGGFNKIAKVFGTSTVETIDLGRGFARGGRIPGAPSAVDDRIADLIGPAGRSIGAVKVASGEFVVNAKDTAKALPLLRWINDGMRGGLGQAVRRIGRAPAMRPGDGSEGYAFAEGGLVGFVKDVWKSVSNPAAAIKAPIEAALRNIPGSGGFRDVLLAMGRKLTTGFTSWIGKLGGGAGSVGKAADFIRAQAGKPYVWAAAGPGGFDCSGIVSAAYNILHGRAPYNHTFSTGSLPGSFFPKPGIGGALTAGWAHPGQRGASANVGHMAGMLAGGLKFESTGSGGVRVGAGASSVSSFAHQGHFAGGGLVPVAKVATADFGQVTLSRGWNMVKNGTGQPEPLSTNNSGSTDDLLRELIAAVSRLASEFGREMTGMQRGVARAARQV
jgi:hypothetical protein